MSRAARSAPPGQHWCSACQSFHPVEDFGPDRSRPPLFLQGRCRVAGAKAKAKSIAKRARPPVESQEALAARLAKEAHADVAHWGPLVNLTPDDLLPFPPVCPLTLDDLLTGDDAQRPTLAMLVPDLGFTRDNTVIVSARARRRHTVIGSVGIRAHWKRRDLLPQRTDAVLGEVIGRANLLEWPAELVAVIAGTEGLTFATTGRLAERPQMAGSEAAAQNWRDLIDGRTDCGAEPDKPAEPRYANGVPWGQRPENWPADWSAWAEGTASSPLDWVTVFPPAGAGMIS
ncbi:hypothetical protein [Variovorax sp. PBL-E5]|uniref:hypothetical protein n=1 Tax=Variovorax sp. PBL-E5 TaxID=434014 RepID=UPI001318ADBE|nr:hypothetical protein [Variovorax sp. PBL-E5]VTU29976.1 hypothetical protein E5CHR_02920 [Variovorax sp. PBL-E5]